MKIEYKKPTIIKSGYYPEPVETGCCLLSCGALRLGAATILQKRRFNVVIKRVKEMINDGK